MSESIIKVEGLGKKYIIAHEEGQRYTALRDVLSNKARKLLRNNQQAAHNREEFWALKDIDFEIKKGEAVGIIGRNGAGKSTLLKILSRITEPTKGRIEIGGRIASLLEVGTGFHPELTGRENIFLNGAILGMSRKEIRDKFDEIVDFSGVEKFLDTPVKRYSSGMYVRLAFAVAAHLEPEILVVDEVLAVGDAEFQKKCLGKMNDVSQKEGRTVLFVSHNMAAVSTLCTTGILMQQGSVIYKGPVADALDRYINNTGKSEGEIVEKDIVFKARNNYLRLKKVSLVGKNGVAAEFGLDEEVVCEIEYEVLADDVKAFASIHLLDRYGSCILATFNSDSASLVKDPLFNVNLAKGIYKVSCTLPANFLNNTSYAISIFLSEDLGWTRMTIAEEVLAFRMHDTGEMRKEHTTEWTGMVRPRLKWHTEKIQSI